MVSKDLSIRQLQKGSFSDKLCLHSSLQLAEISLEQAYYQISYNIVSTRLMTYNNVVTALCCQLYDNLFLTDLHQSF